MWKIAGFSNLKTVGSYMHITVSLCAERAILINLLLATQNNANLSSIPSTFANLQTCVPTKGVLTLQVHVLVFLQRRRRAAVLSAPEDHGHAELSCAGSHCFP